jgi:Arc/MetJ-type ribon-helix-helix transcriptional regulator
MSKITFRADEDLVEEIEELDASKSEVMREALREYLDRAGSESSHADEADDAAEESLDALLAERVDELVAERLAAREPRTRGRAGERPQDVTVNVTLETDAPVRASAEGEVERGRASDAKQTNRRAPKPRTDPAESVSGGESNCGQCGESLSDDHVYCPNCGEKASRRAFCECGDEVRSDWGFCPGCGRRTPAADVLDRS